MSASEFYGIFGGIGDAWTKRREENEARQAATALADAYLGTAGQQPQESGMLANLGRMIGISPQPNSGTSQPQSLMSLGQGFMPQQQQQPEGIQAINRVAPQSGGNQPRGIRNNNPGNIEDGNFARSIPGYAGSDGRFARFESPEGGFQAQSRLLDTYANKYGLNTVSGIINRWAPASDGNNVSAYASSVARQMGVDPNQPLDVRNPQVKAALIGAMIQHENGRNPYAPGQIATAIGGGQSQPVQARLPVGPAGGPMAYTASGQPVQTDAAGNAIQTAPAAQAPATGLAAQASPYGTLDQQPGVPDWKGMAPPAYAPQQAPMPSPVAVRPQAAPMPPQGQPQPYQVAQAGGGMPPAPPQQQQPRFTPEQAMAIRGLLANPQTRAQGMQIIQQQALGNKLQYQTDGEGNIIALDPNGRVAPQVVYKAAVKPIVTGEGQVIRNPVTGAVIGGEVSQSKIAREAADREVEAKRMGLDPNDSRTKQFILTGSYPKEPELTATDKKEIIEADETVSTNRSAIDALNKAKELSKQAWGMTGAGAAASVLSPLGVEGAQRTQELNQVVTEQALSTLRSTFGGNPTEGERKILLDIQGSASMPDAVRQKVYDRAIAAAQRRLSFNEQKAASMRGGQYYKPGNQPSAAKAATPSGPPKAGAVEDGFRFKGGNPADPSAWEKVQ